MVRRRGRSGDPVISCQHKHQDESVCCALTSMSSTNCLRFFGNTARSFIRSANVRCWPMLSRISVERRSQRYSSPVGRLSMVAAMACGGRGNCELVMMLVEGRGQLLKSLEAGWPPPVTEQDCLHSLAELIDLQARAKGTLTGGRAWLARVPSSEVYEDWAGNDTIMTAELSSAHAASLLLLFRLASSTSQPHQSPIRHPSA